MADAGGKILAGQVRISAPEMAKNKGNSSNQVGIPPPQMKPTTYLADGAASELRAIFRWRAAHKR